MKNMFTEHSVTCIRHIALFPYYKLGVEFLRRINSGGLVSSRFNISFL